MASSRHFLYHGTTSRSAKNIFLIRDPREMLPSLSIQLPHATLIDTGLQRQWELYSDLSAADQRPAVLDSRELLQSPGSVIQKLCEHLQIGFDDAMLTWKPGGRPEDGVWAEHWYHAVHKSTGFAPYESKPEFPDRLQELVNDCKPWYEKLYKHALRAGDDV